MLKKLDIYIIKKFLVTFFFSAFLFTLISVVVDFSERIKKLIENEAPAREVVLEYYVHFIPWINGILWPLFALLSVVFFTSRLAKNSEVVAVLASGVSFLRFLRPYIITALLIGAIHAAGVHYFIPEGNKTFIAFKNKYIDPGRGKIRTENIHIFLDANSKIFIRNYRRLDTSMRSVFIEKFDDGQLVKLITADRMEWVGPPSMWTLRDFEIRTFTDESESLVIGKGESLDTSVNLVPRDFVRYSNQREMMTTRELREFIDYESSKGISTAKTLITEYHRRGADSYTLLVLTIIGAAVAARKVRGGMGVHLALGVSIGALYIVLSRFSITFANQLNIPVVFAVWLPNLVFSCIAILLVLRAQK